MAEIDEFLGFGLSGDSNGAVNIMPHRLEIVMECKCFLLATIELHPSVGNLVSVSYDNPMKGTGDDVLTLIDLVDDLRPGMNVSDIYNKHIFPFLPCFDNGIVVVTHVRNNP